jgi:hypothetical protein
MDDCFSRINRIASTIKDGYYL